MRLRSIRVGGCAVSADLSFRRVGRGEWRSPSGWRVYQRRGRFVPVPPVGSVVSMETVHCPTLADAVEVCLRAMVRS